MQAPLAMIYVLHSSTMYAGDCWSTASSSTGRGMLCTATTSNCHQYRKLCLPIHKRSIIVADIWHARSWMLQQLTCAGRLPQPNPRLPGQQQRCPEAKRLSCVCNFSIFCPGPVFHALSFAGWRGASGQWRSQHRMTERRRRGLLSRRL